MLFVLGANIRHPFAFYSKYDILMPVIQPGVASMKKAKRTRRRQRGRRREVVRRQNNRILGLSVHPFLKFVLQLEVQNGDEVTA